VSAPNDPGNPRSGEGLASVNGLVAGSADSAGNTTGSRPTSVSEPAAGSDVPPWQRGRAGRAPAHRPPEPQPRPESPRAPSGHPPGVDARINRFISGGTAASSTSEGGAVTRDATPAHAPEAEQPPTPARNDTMHVEAYPSELPDLSGPVPRPPHRKPSADRGSPEAPSQPSTPTSRIQVGTRHHGPVRASMQIRRVDPWSALKVSLVLSIALFFVWMIAVAFLYLVLGAMGVWSKLNSNVGDLLTSASGQTGGELVSSGTIFGGAALIGLVNIVLMTAAVTLGAFIYNLTTDLVGGVEVTLADRD
jgi:hypothetical protein